MSLYKISLFWIFLSVAIVSCGGGSGSSSAYLPPSYNDDYSNISVTEGSKNIISLIATDTNNRLVTHSIIGGNDEELFSLTANGQLALIKASDFELPHDSDIDNIYEVSVQAAAGADTTLLDIRVSIQDALEGRVVDGPIVGAFVFVDNDGDLVFDDDEYKTTSNAEGFFYINKTIIGCTGICNQRLVARSGIDSHTGRSSNLILMAPVLLDKLVTISPISTLITVATDSKELLNGLGITDDKNDVLTSKFWSLAIQDQVAAKQITKLNLQLSMILNATHYLITPQENVTVMQIAAAAATKLASIISDDKEVLTSKEILSNYFSTLINELAVEINFDVSYIGKLAENITQINALLSEKTLQPTGNISSEILTFSQAAIATSIYGATRSNLDLEQFSEATSIRKIFTNSALIQSLDDFDTDGLANVIDLNDDNDSVDDLFDAFPFDKDETIDTDADGIGNNADTDDDADGVDDENDDYPLNKNVHTAPTAATQALTLNLLPQSLNSITGSLAGTAQDDRALRFSVVTNGSKGTVTINDQSKGDFAYQTLAGVAEPASDTFTFKVNDGYVDSSVSSVTISLKSDPLYKHQWHLDNTAQLNFASTAGTNSKDINIDTVITNGYSGSGVTVAIIDSGLEVAHEDIIDNVVTDGSYNFLDDTTDPTSASTSGDHGTSIAGIIAARAWNNIGGRGVAPEASVVGLNMLKSPTNANVISALGGASYSNNVDIFNLSYGYDTTSSFLINSAVKAQYIDGVVNLRDGKGAIYVTSVGNGFLAFGSANCSLANSNGVSCNNTSMDPEHSLPYVITVGALDANGVRASYSTAGSAIWISAPGGEGGTDINIVGSGYGPYLPGIMTIDQSSCDKGYVRANLSAYANAFENKGNHISNTACNYTSTFYGSSAAAPVVSGVVALLLEANPSLTWRDVKHILATTAVQVDANIEAMVIDDYIAEPAWTTNAAGYKFHNYYGFGGIDASAAITAAKNYTLGSLGTFVTSIEQSSGTLNAPIPDYSNIGRTAVLSDTNNLTVEAINVNVCLSHDRPSDLSIALTSPQGTRSVLLTPFNGFEDISACFNIVSNAFYGENSNGEWEIMLVDKKLDVSGVITDWKLTIFGR
jgi:subtilisin family serine protease